SSLPRDSGRGRRRDRKRGHRGIPRVRRHPPPAGPRTPPGARRTRARLRRAASPVERPGRRARDSPPPSRERLRLGETRPMPGLRQLAIRSSALNFTLTLGLKVLLFAQVVLFTRLFTPEQYGQLSTVLLIVSFVTLLGRLGLNEAMVRESRSPQE